MSYWSWKHRILFTPLDKTLPCVIRFSSAILSISQRFISLMLIVSVLSFSMSYSPPIGHFNFAKIGHYYFALTFSQISFVGIGFYVTIGEKAAFKDAPLILGAVFI